METINKVIQDILKEHVPNENLDSLWDDINTNNGKLDILEQVIVRCTNDKVNGIASLAVLFEYKDMETIIRSKMNKKKIIYEAVFPSVSVNIFKFLFEKLQFGAEDDLSIKSLFVDVINCDGGKLEKLEFLVNHDDLKYFLTKNGFEHLTHLLSSSYKIIFEKFLCVTHSKFMDNKLLETIKVGRKRVNLLEDYFESYLQYQINTGLEQSHKIVKFRDGRKKYTIEYINRYVYQDNSRLMYPKIDYEYQIIHLVKSGYVKREMFAISINETILCSWFIDGLKYGTTRIVDSFVKHGLLTEIEGSIFCKKIHLTKYQVVMQLFNLIVRKKNAKIYDDSIVRFSFNRKGRTYNPRPQLTKDKILN